MKVLLLGGTAEARELAALLEKYSGVQVISSLAGRIDDLRVPSGTTRVGGFGGVEGLMHWVEDTAVDVVVDATHPFAAVMSEHAATATRELGLPLVQLRRPEWTAGPGDRWVGVRSGSEAARVAASLARRIFLTIGRQGVSEFADVDAVVLVRSIEPPSGPVPRNAEILLARGPFTVAEETALLRRHAIDALVTKNSGGPMTEAKLHAARALGLPVVMIARPPVPPATSRASTVSAALETLRRLRDSDAV